MGNMKMAETAVESLQVGMLVDLGSCPYMKDRPAAAMEFAVVAGVEIETEGCTVVMFEDIDHVGYPTGTKLMAGVPDEALEGEGR